MKGRSLQVGILIWMVAAAWPLTADVGFFSPECARSTPPVASPDMMNHWAVDEPCGMDDGDFLPHQGQIILPEPLDQDGRTTYIVRFVEEPISRYRGGVPGLAATSARARGTQRLDLRTAEAEAYSSWLRARQDRHRQDIALQIRREPAMEHRWEVTVNAVALRLSPREAEVIARLDSVAHVSRNFKVALNTDFGPGWIQADAIWQGQSGLPQTRGEGIVIGILDTGINHAHPSFAAIASDGYVHVNPFGEGNYVGWCDPQNPNYDPSLQCNSKLIGTWDFTGNTPEDEANHGSHVAATAAGNPVDALFEGFGFPYQPHLSGVAPRANLISYRVCAPFCQDTHVSAAIEQAVIDGVDVLNESIGIGGDAHRGLKQQAYLGAVEAGVIAVRSAGNSGPNLGSVGPEPPWTLSVAAFTHDRQVVPGSVQSNPDRADRVAWFSSRGPGTGQFFKPNLGGPGVSILAAYGRQADLVETYGLMSGTSMSSPHVAGAAALLRAIRPDWTVTEIYSALSGTARWETMLNHLGEPALPFDIGGGQVDVSAAARSSLVMNETDVAFHASDPAMGGDPRTLNLAGLMDQACGQTCTWERQLRNPTNQTLSWGASYVGNGMVEISPASFTLAPGQTQVLSIAADMRLSDPDQSWKQGRVILQNSEGVAPDFNLPLAVYSPSTSSLLVPPTVTFRADRVAMFEAQPNAFSVDVTAYHGAQHQLELELAPELSPVVGSLSGGLSYDAVTHTLGWTGTMTAPQAEMEAVGTEAVGYAPLIATPHLFLPPGFQGEVVVGFGNLDFSFGGGLFQQLWMSSRGMLIPGEMFSTAGMPNHSLPSLSAAAGALAPLWADLSMEEVGHLRFSWQINRLGRSWHVAEWDGIGHVNDPDLRFSFQVWIERAGSDIRFVYGPGDWESLPAATVGFQDQLKLNGYTLYFDGTGTVPAEGDEFILRYQPEQRSFSFEALITADPFEPAVSYAEFGPVGGATDEAWAAVYRAVASQLAFEQQPGMLYPGGTFSMPVVIRIEDNFGNLVPDNETVVQIILGNDPSGGTASLSGNFSAVAVDGRASFSDLSLDVVGDGYTLIAQSTGLESIESAPFAVLALWDCSRVTDVPQVECEALRELAFATAVSDWHNNSGWIDAAASEICPAFGLTCEAGHVTGVSLGGNNLAGRLPSALGDLSRLRFLRLTDNDLQGHLPDSLGSLSELRLIRLWNNDLSGPLPASWSSLEQLEFLDVGENSLDGSIPQWLGNLANVNTLWLAGNQFTGAMPASLGQLSQLQQMSVWGNQLVGPIPEELSTLSGLRTLHLAFNNFSGEIPAWLGNIALLQDLQVAGNQFSGNLPSELAQLVGMRRFSASGNMLSGPLPSWLGQWSELIDLNLENNQFRGRLPDTLIHLGELENLRLGGNSLYGELPQEIYQMEAMRHLMLANNRLFGQVPDSLTELENLETTWLPGLDFAGNCLQADGDTLAFIQSFDTSFPANQDCRLMLAWLEPDVAPPEGNLRVTLRGIGFEIGAEVEIGNSNCQDVVLVNSTRIECTVPPVPQSGLTAAVDVLVRNPDGQESVLTQGFRYDSLNSIFTDRFELD